MQNWAESIFKNFERILRWIYPGALFLSLLYLTGSDILNFIRKIEPNHSWFFLVLVAAVAGFVIYLFQQQVIAQFISFFTMLSDWDKESDPSKLPWGKYCQKMAKHADKWVTATIARWNSPELLNPYLDYAFARYHATSITAWLTLLFLMVKSPGSALSLIPLWVVILFAVSLLLGSIWEYLWLSRVKLHFDQLRPRPANNAVNRLSGT